MPTTKTETLTCRITPEARAGLREAAAREHRSLANMLEVMIRSYAQVDGRAVAHDAAVLKRGSAHRYVG